MKKEVLLRIYYNLSFLGFVATPSSVLKGCCLWQSGYHMQCQGMSQGWLHAIQVPSHLYYLSTLV